MMKFAELRRVRRYPARVFILLTVLLSIAWLTACDEAAMPASSATEGDKIEHDAAGPAPTGEVGTETGRRETGSAEGAGAGIDSRIVEAHNLFGLLVFEQLLSQRDDRGGNVFISPTSIALALSMAYNGADGRTERAMAEAMQWGGLLQDGLTRDDVNASNFALLRALNALGGAGEKSGVRLTIANSIWHRKEFRLGEHFLRTNERFYDAQVEGLDFALPSSVDTINGWVEDATDGMIPAVVDQLDDDVVMLLINAVYFKGDWTVPFDKNATRTMSFHPADGRSVDVPMMYRAGRMDYYEDTQIQAIRLPYGEDERVAMYVFLPTDHTSLDDVVRRILSDGTERWFEALAPAHGEVMLPRLDISYKSTLKGALHALGMGIAFDGGAAEFGRMLPVGETRRVYMSDVLHHAVLRVDEEGTEAAAVTSVEFRVTSAPMYGFTFTADRPFLVVVRDDVTKAMLFVGAVMNPDPDGV